MAATHFSGPIVSTAGFKPGASAVGLTLVMTGTTSINPASIATLTSAETAVTITGVAAGDIVVMNIPPSLETGLAYSGCRVSAANTVQVRLTNVTAGAVDGAALTWTYGIFRLA